MICETLTNHDFCDNRVHCFIIRSLSLFFKEYLREAKRSAIFTQEQSQEGESVVSFTHEQNSICSQKQLNDIAREHTINL